MRTPRWMAAATVAVLLSACGPSPATEGETPPEAGPTATTPTPEPGPGTPQAAPEDALLAFSGRQLGGGTFDGSVVTGDVVVWFWTPW